MCCTMRGIRSSVATTGKGRYRIVDGQSGLSNEITTDHPSPTAANVRSGSKADYRAAHRAAALPLMADICSPSASRTVIKDEAIDGQTRQVRGAHSASKM